MILRNHGAHETHTSVVEFYGVDHLLKKWCTENGFAQVRDTSYHYELAAVLIISGGCSVCWCVLARVRERVLELHRMVDS